MKVFSLSVILAPPAGNSTVLSHGTSLSSFSFYQRGSVAEFLSFFSKTVAERTAQGQRQSVQENAYMAHVYNRGGPEQLCGMISRSDRPHSLIPSLAVIITDHEYPIRPAFSLLTKILDEFSVKVPQSSFTSPSSIAFPEINAYIEKYQDPKQADTIMKVQQELDETKIVLVSRAAVDPLVDAYFLLQHKTIESVLQRGEKLDSLVERSNALSAQSKMFYKTAKKVRHPSLLFLHPDRD
jgi:synaptobrevin family protein YKT6